MSSEKINNTILLLLLLSSSSYAFHGRNNQAIIHIFLLLNESDWGAYRLNGVRILGLKVFFFFFNFLTLFVLAFISNRLISKCLFESVSVIKIGTCYFQYSDYADLPKYFATKIKHHTIKQTSDNTRRHSHWSMELIENGFDFISCALIS